MNTYIPLPYPFCEEPLSFTSAKNPYLSSSGPKNGESNFFEDTEFFEIEDTEFFENGSLFDLSAPDNETTLYIPPSRLE